MMHARAKLEVTYEFGDSAGVAAAAMATGAGVGAVDADASVGVGVMNVPTCTGVDGSTVPPQQSQACFTTFMLS
ncbi:hypothetical protein PM082_023858 [Marasmius tenuissimus]|nr:hypothetical protein PM082_023858 [Marasmius tenuissimus]